MPEVSRAELQAGARVIRAALGHSLRSLDRDRRAALGLAALMLIVLFAPWYGLVVSAPGAGATHRVLHQSLSGWQALSVPGILSALAALATIGLLLTRTGTPVTGLGAAGRRAARSRADGRVIAVAGAVAGLAELIGLGLAPGYPAALPGASSHTSIRFGLVLGILVAIALTAVGARIAQAPRDAGSGDDPAPPPGRRWRGRTRPRTVRASRARDTRRTRVREESWTEDDAPQFDFVVDRPPR